MKTASDILAMNKAGDLFTNNLDIAKQEYIELSKTWHPDKHGNSKESNDVMAKINQLHERALELIKENKWEGTNYVLFPGKNGKKWELKYKTFFDFELGKTYIGRSFVVYLLSEQYKSFYDNYINVVGNFRFKDDKMKTEFPRYLPNIVTKFETVDGELGIVLKKADDLFLLKDILKYYNGEIGDRHVAWILSVLYNIACFINYNGLSHNGMTLDNIFISPKYHSGALLGGWWYATKAGSKMEGISSEIYNVLPPKARNDRLGTIETDLESIRHLATKLLGKVNYKTLPKGLTEWFSMGSSSTAYEEYSKWGSVLTNSYGTKRFVAMDLTFEQLYKEI